MACFLPFFLLTVLSQQLHLEVCVVGSWVLGSFLLKLLASNTNENSRSILYLKLFFKKIKIPIRKLCQLDSLFLPLQRFRQFVSLGRVAYLE